MRYKALIRTLLEKMTENWAKEKEDEERARSETGDVEVVDKATVEADVLLYALATVVTGPWLVVSQCGRRMIDGHLPLFSSSLRSLQVFKTIMRQEWDYLGKVDTRRGLMVDLQL